MGRVAWPIVKYYVRITGVSRLAEDPSQGGARKALWPWQTNWAQPYCAAPATRSLRGRRRSDLDLEPWGRENLWLHLRGSDRPVARRDHPRSPARAAPARLPSGYANRQQSLRTRRPSGRSRRAQGWEA